MAVKLPSKRELELWKLLSRQALSGGDEPLSPFGDAASGINI